MARLIHLLVPLHAVKPVKGDAVLFFSLHVDGELDPLSLHRSCPVIQGEKWSAPTWIHVRSYENPPVVVPKDAPTRGSIARSGLRRESAGRTQRTRRRGVAWAVPEELQSL
jgi:hypothetical protein